MGLNGVIVGISFTIENWRAFLPDQAEEPAGHLLSSDDALNVSFLPAMKRRRLSNLSKLSLRLAHTVAPDFQGFCVFGSQHGELVTTQGLLESIVQGDIVSPAGFSASVHNTAVGMHSINTKNTFPCISLAAGFDTLAMCFVEASALLNAGKAQEVLLVCADDVVPGDLADYVEGNEIQGFAALIKPVNNPAGKAISLTQEDSVGKTNKNESIQSIVSLLVKEQGSVVVPSETGQWRWQYAC